MFQSTTIPVLEQVLQFAQARHGVLAGNLANLDTPGYRVADLSPEQFQEQLHEAIERRDRPPTTNSPGHQPAAAAHDPVRAVSGSARSILYHDDSNVSIEKQVAEISKNQSVHNLALTIMTNQFRLLQTAISERVV